MSILKLKTKYCLNKFNQINSNIFVRGYTYFIAISGHRFTDTRYTRFVIHCRHFFVIANFKQRMPCNNIIT